jgi:hypothetical protein
MKKRGIVKNSKGQMRVIESIMAALIVISATVFLYAFAATPSSQTYEAGELEKIGHNILHDIDEQRLLSRFVYNGEWANLTAALIVSVPNDVYFNLTVYDVNGNPIGHPLIQYGNSQMFLSSKSVASVTYILSGYQSIYNPRILVLKLVRA